MRSGKYLSKWTQALPGFIILLSDRSEQSSLYCNRIIDILIQRNYSDRVRNRCFIAVLDSRTGDEICTGWLSELYDNPIKIESCLKKVSDGCGGLVEILVNQAVWVEPSEIRLIKDERSVLSNIKTLTDEWIKDHKIKEHYSYQPCSPIIIDIGCNYSAISVTQEIFDDIKKRVICLGLMLNDSTVFPANSYDSLSSPVFDKWELSISSPIRQFGIITQDELSPVIAALSDIGGESISHISHEL